MSPAIDEFIDELATDPTTAAHAQPVADALQAIDLEGDGVPQAAVFMAVAAAVCRTPGSLLHRLRMLAALTEFKGRIRISRELFR